MNRSKSEEDFRFNFCGEVDVTAISDHLSRFDSEWVLDTSRQEMYADHKHTNSYFISEHSNQWMIGDPYALENRCQDPVLFSLVEPIIKMLEKLHKGKVGKALFIRLPAGKVVDAHHDIGEYLNVVRRTHIAITTNDEVGFTIDGETKLLKVGEVWEINNNKLHAVHNNGSTDRVHLLIDVLPYWALPLKEAVAESGCGGNCNCNCAQ